MATLLVGCSSPESTAQQPMSPEHYVPPPTLGFFGRGPITDVEVVARAFWPRGRELSTQDFAFTGFLLFPNRLSSNFVQRNAAAAAFLCLFDDASVAETYGYEPDKMAVFFAPVVDDQEAIEAVRRQRDVDRFLKIYDYFTAERLAKSFGLDISGVYLVGHTRNADGQAGNLQVLDLSGKSPERIEAALLALDEEFSSAAWDAAAANDTSALTIVRRAFDSLGRLLGAKPAVAAAPATCR